MSDKYLEILLKVRYSEGFSQKNPFLFRYSANAQYDAVLEILGEICYINSKHFLYVNNRWSGIITLIFLRFFNMISNFFRLKDLGTDIKTELVGGFTSFITMAYMLIINSKILEMAGMPFEASMAAVIYTTFIGCMIMGLYANRPFAVAPLVGECAFFAYTVVALMGFSWQVVLGAVFLSGVVFFLLTALNIRPWLVNSMPESLKMSFGAGLGIFLALLGLLKSGIVEAGNAEIPVHIGNWQEPKVMLAVFGVVLIVVLLAKKVKAALLLGIIVLTIISFLFGLSDVPSSLMSAPPDIRPVLGQLDILGAIDLKFLPVLFVIFVVFYVDTMGTLIGVSYKAGFLDEKGNLPEIKKPMFADSLTTVFASLLGTTTSGVFLESATGVQTGARSGLSTVFVGVLFLLGLFFAPLFTSIPPEAYAPALIVVGLLMISGISRVDFSDPTEYIPSCIAIVLMVFTYNAGIGMAAGFIAYPLMKLFSGQREKTNPANWILCVISIIFFVLYPY